MSDTRTTDFSRKTKETDISGTLNLDGTGEVDIATGIGFFDHMLTALAFTGHFDLTLHCDGDIEVDQHHTVEDVGIALGAAFVSALGWKAGIARYGECVIPMDEALVRCVLDFSGRAYLRFEIPWHHSFDPLGFDYHLTREFQWGFCRAARITTHIDALAAGNNHHMCEASFKALGRALCQAVAVDPRRAGAVPSTKGAL